MRLLFVGSEAEYQGSQHDRGNGSPFSLFFVPGIQESTILTCYDAVVMPALRFLALQPSTHPVPIIASGPVSMMADCFDGGCTDYMIEPWAEEELRARVVARTTPCLELEHGTIRATPGRIIGPGGSVPLSDTAYRMLVVLYQNRGRAVPRQALACCIERSRNGTLDAGRALDMRMARLRAALRASGAAESARNLRGRHGSYALLA